MFFLTVLLTVLSQPLILVHVPLVEIKILVLRWVKRSTENGGLELVFATT